MIDASFSTPDRPFVKASWRPWFHSYTQAHDRGVQWKGLRPSQVIFLIASCRSRKGSVFFAISAPVVDSVASPF